MEGQQVAEWAPRETQRPDGSIRFRADHTVTAYVSDWRDFQNWCRRRRYSALPAAPHTVALYVRELRGTLRRRPSTIERRLVSISLRHRDQHVDDPTQHPEVRTTWQWLRRSTDGSRAKDPILLEDLLAVTAGLGESLRDTRDRALLLLAFAGALRRVDVEGLTVEDVRWVREGVVLSLRSRPAGPGGEPQEVGVPRGKRPDLCPVRALKAWLDMGAITQGPLFRAVRDGHVTDAPLGGHDMARAVKRAAVAAGRNPARYSFHSLRAGLAVSAAAGGGDSSSIAQQTGLRDASTLNRYVTKGRLFRNNAARLAGL